MRAWAPSYRNHVRAPTGYGFVYSTEIAEVDRLHRIDVISSGDIVGRGRFLVSDGPSGGKHVSFAWLLRDTEVVDEASSRRSRGPHSPGSATRCR